MTQKPRITAPAKESKWYSASEYRKIIERMGFAVVYPKGVSMRPLIWEENHYVVIQRLEGEPAIGDILAFEHIRRGQTSTILHRLVDIKEIEGEQQYIMLGDNCLNYEKIRREDILGKVTEIYRNGSWKLLHAVPKSHFTLTDPYYQFYSKFWGFCRPLRQTVIRGRMLLSKIKHKIL